LACCFVSIVLVAACGGPPPKKVKEPRPPEDPWDAAPHSGEWLYVTRDVQGGHETECQAVAEWIAGESACEANACGHGSSLAKDWLSRCPAIDKDDEPAVRDMAAKLKQRARGDDNACATDAEAILRGECDGDASCKTAAQSWATRCGATLGSPLVMRMVERSVERKVGKRTTLDARNCDELFGDVKKGVACANQIACGDATKAVTTYRARCVSDEEPDTIAAASAAASVLVGAGERVPKLAVRASKVSPRDVATALEDGSGVALSVCGERVQPLAGYVQKRAACKDGAIVFARAVKSGDGLELRVGTLPFPDDVTFAARFPSLVVHGEAELRDAQALAGFEAALDKAAALASSDAAGALPVLAKAVAQNAAALRRTPAFREALTARDAALVPALKELGKLKAKAAKTKLTVAELSGLLARADTRAFADVLVDGTVSVGGQSRASELDTVELLPRSMAAYREGVKPALALGKLRKVDAKTSAMALKYGKMKAQACGEAERKLSQTEGEAIACAFGATPCDDAKLVALGTVLDEARAAAESARHQLDLVTTGPAAGGKDELVQVAATAGCLDPWW
jgi:hypothetical protein